MAVPPLLGSYPLDAVTIKKAVSRKSAGAFVLGYTQNDAFYPRLVGRSDDNIAGRLTAFVMNPKYKRFMFCYAASPTDAFQRECALFHEFSPGDNAGHPERPPKAAWKCPRCKKCG